MIDEVEILEHWHADRAKSQGFELFVHLGVICIVRGIDGRPTGRRLEPGVEMPPRHDPGLAATCLGGSGVPERHDRHACERFLMRPRRRPAYRTSRPNEVASSERLRPERHLGGASGWRRSRLFSRPVVPSSRARRPARGPRPAIREHAGRAIASATARGMSPSIRDHARDQRMRAAISHAVVTPSWSAATTWANRCSWCRTNSSTPASRPTNRCSFSGSTSSASKEATRCNESRNCPSGSSPDWWCNEMFGVIRGRTWSPDTMRRLVLSQKQR